MYTEFQDMQGLLRWVVVCFGATALMAQQWVTIAGAVDDAGPALGLANLQNECDPGRFEQGSFLWLDGAGAL